MKPTLVESMLPASERVATGEIPIALTFVKFAYSAAQSGAPLEYVRLERMLGDTYFVVLGSKAPHLNAGKAFVDFYLDDEAMKILAQSGEFVNRKGIYPPLPGADKIQYLQMEVLEAKLSRTGKRNSARFFCAKDATSEREPSDSVRSLGALYQDLA
jgi:iron(III) transport system substrate-binding protein